MNDRRTAAIGGWMGIGAGIGVALGVAMDNLPLWTPIGLVLGSSSAARSPHSAMEIPECR